MIFDQWDVVLALFPFTDRSRAKGRPVAVLSTKVFNRDHGLLVAAMITTAGAGRWSSDHALVDLAPTGLLHASVVRWKIMTLASGVVSGRIGRLSDHDQHALSRQLAAIMPTGNPP